MANQATNGSIPMNSVPMYGQPGLQQPSYMPQGQQVAMQPQYTDQQQVPQYTSQPQYNQGAPPQANGYNPDMKDGPNAQPGQQQIYVTRAGPQQVPMQQTGQQMMQPMGQQMMQPTGQQMMQPGQLQAAGAPQQYHSASPLSILGQASAPVDCPTCRHRSMTMTVPQVGNTNHAWAAGFCLFLGLGCIPYFITSFKDVRHNCGHCGALLATWHRSGRTVVHTFA